MTNSKISSTKRDRSGSHLNRILRRFFSTKTKGKKTGRLNRRWLVEEVPECDLIPINRCSASIRYEFGQTIGRGGFSKVKECVEKETGQRYAAKIIDKGLMMNVNVMDIDTIRHHEKMLEREVEILRRIRHPNVISIVGIYDHDNKLTFIMELARRELHGVVVENGAYSENDASAIVRQVVEALQYLHSNGIVHRDLKLENLLLSESEFGLLNVKLADFGLSQSMEICSKFLTTCGTPGYVAPEILLEKGYSHEVDVWGVGVVMYILVSGYPPFYGKNNQRIFQKILSGNYEFSRFPWNSISPEAKDLIKKCLVVNPKQRISLEEMLQHPWLKQSSE